MLTAPTVHCSLPSCILRCSEQLFGLAVVEYDFALEPDGVQEGKISLCTRRLRSLSMTVSL